jgi:hypothetical protein
MPVETDLERRLREALHGQSAVDPLPEHVLVDSLSEGRTSLRGRRRRAAVGSVAALAAVAALALAVVQRDEDAPQPAVPSPSPTPSPTPTPTTEPETAAPAAWADSLPLGPGPGVPFVAGSVVVQPDGSRVETGGNGGVGVIGLTVRGLVLLVAVETENPYSYTASYAVVTDAGDVEELPASTLTRDSAQEALVSPDGRYFTNGGPILDMTDLSVVGEVPEAATIMLAWTPVGIVYSSGDYGKRATTYHLLRSDGSVVDLDGDPGVYPNGTDIGLHGCRAVRLSASGATPVSDCIQGVRSISPSGRWALTADLRLVDVETGDSRYLAGAPVKPLPFAYDKVHWDGDESLLLPVFGRLVRCGTVTGECTRATAETENHIALP